MLYKIFKQNISLHEENPLLLVHCICQLPTKLNEFVIRKNKKLKKRFK